MWPQRALCCSLLCACTAPALAEELPLVAVFNVEQSRVSLPPEAIAALSDYLATQVVESGRFQIVPRDELKRRLLEQKQESYKACYAESCQIELGKEMAAQKSLATRLMKLGSSCKVSLTMYDLRSGTSERAATEAGACDEDAIVATVERGVAKLLGAPAAPQAQAAQAALPQAGPEPSKRRTLLHSLVKSAEQHQPSATGAAPGQDLPEAPMRVEVSIALRALHVPVRQCAAQHGVSGKLTAKLVFAPGGEVSSAELEGIDPASPGAQCIRAVLLRAHTSASQKGLSVRYPLSLK